MRRRLLVLAAAFWMLAGAGPVDAAAKKGSRARRPAPPPPLVWHVEDLAGGVIDSRGGDEAINPASVVKVATSLWAVERLGPEFRFETRFSARGRLDPRQGLLRGDLVVTGVGDPDFHAENAFLVAASLNRLGIREVTGTLVVNRKFWMGWENGSAGTNPDPLPRGLTMAGRLRQAFDSGRWGATMRRTWREFAAARGLEIARPPRVTVRGGVGVDGDADPGELLLVHRSETLATALRRFNCYSNNDIERIGAAVGPTEELSALIAVRCGLPSEAVRLETTSGLGTNRMSPQAIVRMLHEFRDTCQRAGLGVEALLPVSGCDAGTVTRFFPALASGANATSVAGKTGTLTSTDGGVAVVAGYANTAAGELVFCVAAPNAGGRLKAARQAQERWLLDLIAAQGGPRPRACSPPLGGPDAGAEVIVVKTSE